MCHFHYTWNLKLGHFEGCKEGKYELSGLDPICWSNHRFRRFGSDSKGSRFVK